MYCHEGSYCQNKRHKLCGIMGVDVFILKQPTSPITIFQNTVVSQRVSQSDHGPTDMIGGPLHLDMHKMLLCDIQHWVLFIYS